MTHQPPAWAEALLGLALPPEEEGAVLGDLREEHARRARESGARAADRWYRRQVLRSLGPTLARRVWRVRNGFRGPASDDTGGGSMAGTWKDLRYAVRSLAARPAWLTVAVLTLALGIGGGAALLSVVHDTLLRPLPYPDEDELVWFWQDFSWRPSEIVYMRDRWDGFRGVAGWTTVSVTFRLSGGATSQFPAVAASDELFDVLGSRPALGRTFQAGDDAPGAPPVVVVSHAVWRDQLGADGEAVGRAVVVDGTPRTVVGVMPEGFYFPERSTGLWIPGPLHADGGSGSWSMLGRLPEGRSLEDMGPELERITRLLGERFTYADPRWDRTRNPFLTPLRDKLVGDVGTALLLTLGAVGLIFLMACANVAALTLARTHGRRRELAVRSALGAGRGRLARQLLLESLVVGLVAGVAGALLARGGFDLVLAALPVTEPLAEGVRVDWRVFGSAFVLAVATALLVGSAPVFALLRGDLRGGLASSRGAATGRGRLERALVVAEVALAVLLVTGAGLVFRSVERLRGVEPGFDPERLLAVGVTMGAEDFDTDARARLLDDARAALERLPGVSRAAAIQVPPLWGAGWNFGLTLEGRDDLSTSTLYRIVTPGYFETTGIDVLRGRGFEETDEADGEPVVVVNEAFVREFFPDGRALGRRMTTGTDDRWATVVGVTEDAAETGLREPVGPLRYVLGRQVRYVDESQTFLIRTPGDPLSVAEAARRTLRDLDSRLAIARVETMTDAHRRAMGRTAQLVPLFGALGVLALLLGAVGVYGVVGHFVSRRTREWGVRMALGQRPGSVIGLVLRQGLVLVVGGVALGLAGSALAAGFLSAILYGVGERDPVAFTGAGVVLVLVGVVAAGLPAWRAARVDPAISLGAE